MNLRILSLLCFCALLGACAGEPSSPSVPTASPPQPAAPAPVDEPLPANLREVIGSLQNVPAGGDVELALLSVDERDRPQRLLGSLRLKGTGAALPFRLRFNPEIFPTRGRVELRGRVSQSGLLVQHLPSRPIQQPQNQNVGALQMVPAP